MIVKFNRCQTTSSKDSWEILFLFHEIDKKFDLNDAIWWRNCSWITFNKESTYDKIEKLNKILSFLQTKIYKLFS